MPDLVPIQEAAAEFGLNRVTLHRLIRQGKLTRYKAAVRNKTFVDRVELRALTAPQPTPTEGNP